MDFHYESLGIRSAALSLDYHLVPWDTEILGVPVAQIADVRVLDPPNAQAAFIAFRDWCSEQRVRLCAARVPTTRMVESTFLEQNGFRFVELNYQPELTELQSRSFPGDTIRVLLAEPGDRAPLQKLAAGVFRHGRFHQDPLIDPAIGDRRYAFWLDNAFEQPHQIVLKCILDDDIVGFFVIEKPSPGHCHWSLNALAGNRQGVGLGKRVWRAVLEWHQSQGIRTVSTSISSHNVSAFNLYVSLGFRFPTPAVTLHWCPLGRLVSD